MSTPSVSTKIKSILELPSYVANVTPPATFKHTDNRPEYSSYTLVNGRTTELLTVIGVISFVKFMPGDVSVTITLESKFMPEQATAPWVTSLTDLAQQTPLGTSEDFFGPCREKKMRFVNKPKDKALVGALEVVNVKGKAIDGSGLARGDLVVIDFAMQSYFGAFQDKKALGSRLVLQSLQLLESAYDDSFTRKVDLPETPTKRRKY
jgi:hypothetical protein